MRLAAAVSTVLFFCGAASHGTGRLCVAGTPCVEGARLPAAVVRGVARTFTWMDAEDGRIVFGTVAANAERAEAAAAVEVKFRLRSKDSQRWPARATLLLRDAERHEWRLDLSPREARREWI